MYVPDFNSLMCRVYHALVEAGCPSMRVDSDDITTVDFPLPVVYEGKTVPVSLMSWAGDDEVVARSSGNLINWTCGPELGTSAVRLRRRLLAGESELLVDELDPDNLFDLGV